jgi:uncharacterized protein YbaP (TraB family)
LWRISGQGLKQPSYLYGTMHLQDKRLFNFGDSLYRFLEKAEGFAMEIDFHDYLDTIMQRSIQEREEAFLSDKEEVEVDTKKLGRGADSLLREFGITKNKITRKQLKKIRDYRMNRIVQEGDMPTIVDAYLYGLALRQQKWLGGIEDVHDQLDLVDELGNDLNVSDVFAPEERLRYSMEQLIKIYLDQDLQSIAEYSYGHTSDVYTQKVLIQRNIKMARRMDSLSTLRSMFFAIGAAHLPGDSGVISFLRHKGFTVEPVFSSQKITAGLYAGKLDAISWTKVTDDNHLYSVEMPGIPSDHNIFGELLKMKMFFDITTMTVYMTGNTMANVKTPKEMDEALRSIAQTTGGKSGKVISKINITVNGVHGVEGIVENRDGVYRLRLLQKENVLYILMAGSTKTAKLTTTDVERFFTSFQPAAAVKKDWVKFELPEKGFAISIPGQPKRNKLFEQQADGSNWNFTVYDHVDIASGLYFVIQIRELREGYYLNGDSSYLAQFKENLASKLDVVTLDQKSTYQGFPSLQYNGISKEDNLSYKTVNVIRGNRIYTLMVAGTARADSSGALYFMNSLSLQPNQPAKWMAQYSAEGGFATTAPSAIKKVPPKKQEDSTVAEDKQEHFLSFDPGRVVSYEVFKESIPQLYWTKDDSSFFDNRINNYIASTDSTVDKRRTRNGGLQGMEALVQMKDNNNIKKIRVLLNGDTLYTLIAFIARPYIAEPEHQRFFDDFRIKEEKATTVFTNKAAQLMEALNTDDSAKFENASDVLKSVDFEQADLPVLQAALLHKYRDFDAEGYTAHDRIRKAVVALQDSTTIDFIRHQYAKLAADKEELKYPLLSILAEIRTASSYRLLKELLLTKLPGKGMGGMLVYPLLDSIALTRQLYPEVLVKSRDSIFREVLVMVTNHLIDSGLLQVREIMPYQSLYMEEAARHLEALSDSSLTWWPYSEDWIYFIGKFNNHAANKLLQRFMHARITSVKESAIIALLENNQPVDPAEMEQVAADKELRISLYETLRQMQQQHLFPAKYANQKSLAESELFLIATDEMEVTETAFIGERVAAFMGQKQKFYLFRFVYKNEDESGSYLGIAGPYPLKQKTLITAADATDIFWDEEYEKAKLDKQFRNYLAQMEESLRE